MTSPPGSARLTQNGITGTRTKAEIRRELADRINAAGRRAGVQLHGWQVRLMTSTLLAADEVPTEEEFFRGLMSDQWRTRRGDLIYMRSRPRASSA